MITLVPLLPAHAHVLSDASSNDDFLRGLLYEKRLNHAEARKDILRILARQRKKEMIVRSIDRDGTIIGRVGVAKKGNRWFLFYWIVPELHGRGYGTAAVELFLPLSPRPLYAEVFEWNKKSKNILIAHGAQKHADVYRID